MNDEELKKKLISSVKEWKITNFSSAPQAKEMLVVFCSRIFEVIPKILIAKHFTENATAEPQLRQILDPRIEQLEDGRYNFFSFWLSVDEKLPFVRFELGKAKPIRFFLFFKYFCANFNAQFGAKIIPIKSKMIFKYKKISGDVVRSEVNLSIFNKNLFLEIVQQIKNMEKIRNKDMFEKNFLK